MLHLGAGRYEARGEQGGAPKELARSALAREGWTAPRPAKSARSRRHGRDPGPKTAARALCGRMYAASPIHSKPQAAAHTDAAHNTYTTRSLHGGARKPEERPQTPECGRAGRRSFAGSRPRGAARARSGAAAHPQDAP